MSRHFWTSSGVHWCPMYMDQVDMETTRHWIATAALFGFLAVALGAFAAHGLEGRIPADRLAVFKTSAQYQMYHALALLAVGLLKLKLGTKQLDSAAWAFTAGIFLFSGSLYLLAVTGVRWLGAITPLGGLAFLTGWTLLGITMFRKDDI